LFVVWLFRLFIFLQKKHYLETLVDAFAWIRMIYYLILAAISAQASPPAGCLLAGLCDYISAIAEINVLH